MFAWNQHSSSNVQFQQLQLIYMIEIAAAWKTIFGSSDCQNMGNIEKDTYQKNGTCLGCNKMTTFVIIFQGSQRCEKYIRSTNSTCFQSIHRHNPSRVCLFSIAIKNKRSSRFYEQCNTMHCKEYNIIRKSMFVGLNKPYIRYLVFCEFLKVKFTQ